MSDDFALDGMLFTIHSDDIQYSDMNFSTPQIIHVVSVSTFGGIISLPLFFRDMASTHSVGPHSR